MMTTLEKVATYLRSIEREQSLAKAQLNARLALRLIEADEKTSSGNRRKRDRG